jgi:hypothetical protein
MPKGATATRWFSLIRTLTVGSGITPNPPVIGYDRVADFHCRFEITSTPKNNTLILAPCFEGFHPNLIQWLGRSLCCRHHATFFWEKVLLSVFIPYGSAGFSND